MRSLNEGAEERRALLLLLVVSKAGDEDRGCMIEAPRAGVVVLGLR